MSDPQVSSPTSFDRFHSLQTCPQGTILSVELTEPSFNGFCVLVEADSSTVTLLLPSSSPSSMETLDIPIASLDDVYPVGLLPLPGTETPWTYIGPESYQRCFHAMRLQRPLLHLHRRSKIESEVLLQSLELLMSLQGQPVLIQQVLDRLYLLNLLGNDLTMNEAVFLYDAIEYFRSPDEWQPRHAGLSHTVPLRLQHTVSAPPYIHPEELDLPHLSSFTSFQDCDHDRLWIELDSLVLGDGLPKDRPLQNYLSYKHLLGFLLYAGQQTPALWRTSEFCRVGELWLQEILILERLNSTSCTRVADELRELFEMTMCPAWVQDARPVAAMNARDDLYYNLHRCHLWKDGQDVAFAPTDYYLWSILAARGDKPRRGAGSPGGNRYNLTEEHPYFNGCENWKTSWRKRGYKASVRAACELMDISPPTDRELDEQATAAGLDVPPRCDPSLMKVYDQRQQSTEDRPVIRTSMSSSNPFGKQDTRTCLSWQNRSFTEKVLSAEEPGYDYRGGTAFDGGALSGRVDEESKDARTRRWLPYFVEDFYNLNYHMFIDFSDWIKPHRSHTLQGDLAPITTNIINLEKLEALDPSLTALYNLLRHEHCFDALTDPTKETSVKDRVRLSSGQLAQATDWTIIEELASRPAQGYPVGIFTVPKKDPSLLRLIVDGRPWNQTQVRPEKMPIPRLLDTIRDIQGMNYAVQYDGVSFFYQFAARHSRFHFRKHGKWYRFCRMPMGWSYAPLIAQKTANAVLAETLKRLGKRVLPNNMYTACWVDNFILAAKTERDLRLMEEEFLKVAEEVSLELKKEDQVDLRHFKFAGIEHDLELHKYRPVRSPHVIDNFKEVRDVMKGCGTAIWQLYARSKRLCFYDHLLSAVGRLCTPAMRGDCTWDAKLDRYLRKGDLALLQELVTHAKDESWEVVPPPHAQTECPIWFDASSVAWAFVSDDCSFGGQGIFRSPEQLHIFVKEGTAFLAAVRATVDQFPGRRRIFFTDNMPLAKAFKKGHSSNHAVNRILRRVYNLLDEHDCEIELIWVPTDVNKSDRYTRGAKISMPKKIRRVVEAEPLIASHSRRLKP